MLWQSSNHICPVQLPAIEQSVLVPKETWEVICMIRYIGDGFSIHRLVLSTTYSNSIPPRNNGKLIRLINGYTIWTPQIGSNVLVIQHHLAALFIVVVMIGWAITTAESGSRVPLILLDSWICRLSGCKSGIILYSKRRRQCSYVSAVRSKSSDQY